VGGGTISVLDPRAPIEWERFEIGSGGRIDFYYRGDDESRRRIGVSERFDKSDRSWTIAEAARHIRDWSRQHERDFEDFRRDWHRGHHDHHGHGGGGDDDLPKPVPLPAAALLFGPALLMLRGFQRRNA
jgi:hypothetical protein